MTVDNKQKPPFAAPVHRVVGRDVIDEQGI